jgi:SAM-dependent methyltransferase
MTMRHRAGSGLNDGASLFAARAWQGERVSDEPASDLGSDEVWGQRRTSFGIAADSYASGRPHYPREILEWCLPPGARNVLDLGAGTGITAAGLLDLGLNVTAVEPLAEMRALIPASARALDGTAEAIPLPDTSIDAVFVGQAWHWFDPAPALAEAHRVLREGGTLNLMWNLLDTDNPLSRTIADIIDAEERSDMMLDGEAEQPPYDADESFSPPERRMLKHSQSYDTDRVVEFALSRSQSILRDPGGRQAMIEALRAAMPTGEFAIDWICEAWRSAAI